MSNQQFFDEGNLPAPDLETLSGEGGADFGPLAHNFNFSGSVAGGAAANGAIIFHPTGPGEMDAAVQVDNVTMTINASNKLVAIGSMVWTLLAASQTAVFGVGYFINVGLNLTLTLPAVATIGQTFAVYALSGSTFVIQCGAGQTIQVGNQISSVAGSVTSIDVGDFIFVKAITSTAFVALPFNGNLTVA